MDFIVKYRIKYREKFLKFLKNNKEMEIVKQLSQNTREGDVFMVKYGKKFVTKKVVDLAKLYKSKNSVKLYNMTINDYLKLNKKNTLINYPSLIETHSYRLINELIFFNVCPNFQMNYYSFVTTENNKLKEVVIYNEYIEYGDLEKFLTNNELNDKMMFNILFQIIIALTSMKIQLNMIHYDLHKKNILVKKVEKGGYWTYILNKHKYYLKNMVFVILLTDFGFANIPTKLVFSVWHLEDVNFNKHTIDYYDMFKIINSFNHIVDKNGNAKNLPELFKFVLQSCFIENEINRKISLLDKIQNIFIKGVCYNKYNIAEYLPYNLSNKPKNSFNIETYKVDKRIDTKLIQYKGYKNFFNQNL